MSKIEILASILRNETDCTNGGISSKTSRITIIGEFDEVPEDSLFPVLRLKTRGDHKYLSPVAEVPEGHTGWMMGGNFAFSSDAMFTEKFSNQPIAIHDRSESWEQYKLMST